VIIYFALLLAAAVASGLLGVWHFRDRAYRRFFRYDRRREQSFDFEQSAAIQMNVEVSLGGFIWPDTPKCDTGFLEINLSARGLGHSAEPSIEIRSRDFQARQYFERGARGTRYLNLGAILAEPPTAGQGVSLQAHGVSWPLQQARLLLFDNTLSASETALVIAPHPDDAEIAAFGLYSRFHSTVVTITDGALGSFYLDELPATDPRGSEITARIRAWDSITAPFFGNVPPERAINLGYPDASLEAMFSAPETSSPLADGSAHRLRAIRALNLSPLLEDLAADGSWRGLVMDLIRILEKVKPSLIVIPHPLLDDHPDHAFSAVAVCAAVRQAGLTNGRLLLYTNHSPHSNLHPVGQNDGTVSLPPHFGEPLQFGDIWSLALTPDQQRAKLLAIEAHHDLRALPSLQPASLAKVCRTFLAGLRNLVTGLDAHVTGYFRRAVRPNEIFFTARFEDASQLSAQFLEQWKAGKLKWHVFK
jgi:LmbE family N-acetylglucosaminyl deacetylase